MDRQRKKELIRAIKTGDPKKIVRATCRVLAKDKAAIAEITRKYLEAVE